MRWPHRWQSCRVVDDVDPSELIEYVGYLAAFNKTSTVEELESLKKRVHAAHCVRKKSTP